jgi:hypothetical protein
MVDSILALITIHKVEGWLSGRDRFADWLKERVPAHRAAQKRLKVRVRCKEEVYSGVGSSG